jgi:alkylation response protein AidB-like acyl-CoA dehydrogenase
MPRALSEEQEMIRERARRFSDSEIAPIAQELRADLSEANWASNIGHSAASVGAAQGMFDKTVAGSGIMDSTGVNRYFRDARASMVAEGPSDLHYDYVAAYLLDRPADAAAAR